MFKVPRRPPKRSFKISPRDNASNAKLKTPSVVSIAEESVAGTLRGSEGRSPKTLRPGKLT